MSPSPGRVDVKSDSQPLQSFATIKAPRAFLQSLSDAIETGIGAPNGEEILVAALFDDSPVLKDQNAVGAANRRKPVGDDDRRAPGHELFAGGLDLSFGLDIEG